MKTLYAACLSRLGLSQAEAASLHGAGLSTIKHWTAGRRDVPDGVWQELRDYEAQIVDRSETIREVWEDAGELRDVVMNANGIAVNMMAAADFLLTNDADPPVLVRVT